MLAFYFMTVLFEIDQRHARDTAYVISAMEKNSILSKIALGVLHYISNFALFGSYRLAWNLVCIPFLHVFSLFMQFFFIPGPL